MSQIDWKEVLDWGDDEFDDLRLAGYAYIRQGKYDIALSFFEALNILEKNNAYDAQTLGALYIELGNPSKALLYFDKALKLDTDHTPTLLNLTKALFMLNRQDEALKLAAILQNEPNPQISNIAKALILAYS